MSSTLQKLIHGHHPERAQDTYAGAKKRRVDLIYQHPTKGKKKDDPIEEIVTTGTKMASPTPRRSRLSPQRWRRRRSGYAGGASPSGNPPIFYAISKVKPVESFYIEGLSAAAQWGSIAGLFSIYGWNLGGIFTYADVRFEPGFRSKLGYVSIAGWAYPILDVQYDRVVCGVLSQSKIWQEGLQVTSQKPLRLYYWTGNMHAHEDPEVIEFTVPPKALGCGSRCFLYRVPRKPLKLRQALHPRRQPLGSRRGRLFKVGRKAG